MNSFDQRLDRLLKAASQAPRRQPPADMEMPFGLDTRVLAHCFAQAADEGAAALRFFQKALLCSCAVMALSCAVSFYYQADSDYRSDSAPLGTEADLAASAIETSLP